MSNEDIPTLVIEMRELFNSFEADAMKTGNKAAQSRARAASLKLRKNAKRFRELSLKQS